jgi:hypothetical protein
MTKLGDGRNPSQSDQILLKDTCAPPALGRINIDKSATQAVIIVSMRELGHQASGC